MGRGPARQPMSALRPRERECAALVAEGLSNAEIAERMVISIGSVENYMGILYAYYGLDGAARTNRVKLAQAIDADTALARIMGE